MNSVLSGFLNRVIRHGSIKISDANGDAETFGDGTGDPIHIRINNPSIERAIAIDPELKFAEAYIDGDIDIVEGDVYGVLKTVYGNTKSLASEAPILRALQGARRVKRRLAQINTLSRARRNVQHHYDLSGELYRLFLDPDLQYSCAYYTSPDISLAEAQLAKKRHIAAKLVLEPGQTVLDIGCGWGGLGLYLARYLNSEVTGVTLSEEQFRVANERAKDGSLHHHAQFHLRDYREVQEKFDRIVSVGMFEHVGVGHYSEFFRTLSKRLKKDGVALLHTIGRTDGPSYTNPFINKYIFPGGYIPALSEVIPHIERTGLIVTDVEILRLHYAETLKAWSAAFAANRETAKKIYDERFCRMWEFYLAASESAFRWQNLVVFQIQLAHDQSAVPLTRDYIGVEEKRLKRLERQQTSANTEMQPVLEKSR